jgi:hypothetical protein
LSTEELLPGIGVSRIRKRLVDLEVVAPAGELETVEAPPTSLLDQLFQRKVGPLAGEQRDDPGDRRPP